MMNQLSRPNITLSIPCSSKSEITDLSKALKFTVRNVLRPVSAEVNTVYLDVGDFQFKIEDYSIQLLQTKINQMLNLIESRQKKLKFLHFNCSTSSIWVSVYALDRHNASGNYIKFGQGYVMENNLIAHFQANSKQGVDLLRNISRVDFDQNVNVTEKICVRDHFEKDFEPLIFDPQVPFTISELKRNLVFPDRLPKEGQKLYTIINKVHSDKQLIDAINYSLDNEGCALNKKLTEKSSFSSDKKNSYIRVPLGLSPTQFGQPGQPIVLEIWPKVSKFFLATCLEILNFSFSH